MKHKWGCKEELEKRFPHVNFYGPARIKNGVEIGDGTGVGEYVVISNNARIGKNCIILYHVSICKDAVIGDSVFLGPGARLLNDKYPPTKISYPPIISAGAVVGGDAILLPGVVVHHRAVVGAGSVVTKDVPRETVVAGNPAREIGTREEYDVKQAELLRRLG